MSKLTVEDFMVDSESRPLTVHSTLEEGRRVNFIRCYEKKNPVDPERKAVIRNCDKFKPLWKIVYPHERKYSKCQQQKGFVLDRLKMERVDHLRLLAKPKKFQPPRYPKWAQRKIPPCTAIIDNLAQPKRLHVLNSFDSHLKRLSIHQIENFLSVMFRTEYKTPEEMTKIVKCSLRGNLTQCNRQKKTFKKRKPRSLEEIDNASSHRNLLRRFISILSDVEENVNESSDREKYSDVILIQLCNLLKQNVPHRDSSNIVDRVLVKFANKMATCLINFANCSGVKQKVQNDLENECINEHLENCYPIEDCNEEQVSDNEFVGDEDDQEGSVTSSSSSEKIVSDEIKQMSFLSFSKVVVDPKDCQEIQEIIAQTSERKEAKAAKAAEKLAQKAARAEVRQAVKLKKIMKAGKLGALADCLGDVNKKPQWEIEWQDNPGN